MGDELLDFDENWIGSGQFNYGELEDAHQFADSVLLDSDPVQSQEHQELGPYLAVGIQGSSAGNDQTQSTQEQNFQPETSSRQRKRKSVELTLEEIEMKRLETNLKKQQYRKNVKSKYEGLEREMKIAKRENESLKQMSESQEKEILKLKELEAEWKRKYIEQLDRVEDLANQVEYNETILKEYESLKQISKSHEKEIRMLKEREAEWKHKYTEQHDRVEDLANQVEYNETIQREYEALKSKSEFLEREMKAMREGYESLKQISESQEKKIIKSKESAAKWKRKYIEQHDRVKDLADQVGHSSFIDVQAENILLKHMMASLKKDPELYKKLRLWEEKLKAKARDLCEEIKFL